MSWDVEMELEAGLRAKMASVRERDSALGMEGMAVSVAMERRGARHCCIISVLCYHISGEDLLLEVLYNSMKIFASFSSSARGFGVLLMPLRWYGRSKMVVEYI